MIPATTRPWRTSCEGHIADTTPMELSALGEHLAVCNASGPRRVALHCGVQRLMAIVMTRLVSAAALTVALIAAVWLVL